VVAVAVNWSAFTSEDRDAGGVASPNEVHDRLNTIATSISAFEEKPLLGWGIGRFAAVNTYHHEQWSPAIPWERGYGIASHVDVLGIAVELGVVGVLLWITLLALLGARLAGAVRQSSDAPDDRAYALTALFAFGALVVTGLTVDLRFFDYPNIVVMLWAGSAIGLTKHLGRDEVLGRDGLPTPAGTRGAARSQPEWS
jgi:O-antigen ligase